MGKSCKEILNVHSHCKQERTMIQIHNRKWQDNQLSILLEQNTRKEQTYLYLVCHVGSKSPSVFVSCSTGSHWHCKDHARTSREGNVSLPDWYMLFDDTPPEYRPLLGCLSFYSRWCGRVYKRNITIGDHKQSLHYNSTVVVPHRQTETWSKPPTFSLRWSQCPIRLEHLGNGLGGDLVNRACLHVAKCYGSCDMPYKSFRPLAVRSAQIRLVESAAE